MRMASGCGKFYTCRCYFTNNYFMKNTGKHYFFTDVEKFHEDYQQELEKISDDTRDKLINELLTEQRRRRTLVDCTEARIQRIRLQYTPLHPDVYTLKEEYLQPSFLDIVNYSQSQGATVEGLISRITTCKAEQVYSFPVFTQGFCDRLLQELDHYQHTGIPSAKPNTMNNYGLMLNELGFDECFISPLRVSYLQPLARLLYPQWSQGGLDSHKAFTVRYELAGDTDLNFHFDNAEVTINVCLGKDFDEGSLFFGKMRTEPQTKSDWTELKHRITHGVIHRGQHKHGAMPVQDGLRMNLIVWMRSSTVRNALCPMCDQVPERTDGHGFADGFTEPTENVCQLI